jgi:hypothetical protein
LILTIDTIQHAGIRHRRVRENLFCAAYCDYSVFVSQQCAIIHDTSPWRRICHGGYPRIFPKSH